MNHFPVTNSNLSAEHLAIFLQENYHLGNIVECKLLRAGINHTYTVFSGINKFVFRVYSLNWRTGTEISEEIKLLNQLKEHQVSVSYPIVDKKENYIQTLNAPEGDRFGVLFTYANGKKQHQFTDDTHYQVGALMAQLHQITLNLSLKRVDYTPQVILVDSLVQLNNFLPSDTAEMDFMKSAQKYLLNEFSNVNKNEIRKGVVHLDIWFENMNITSENEITIFDFDFCGNGWLCYDLAFYILQIYNIGRYEKDSKLRVESFLKGYESITKISDEEKRIIPMLGVSLYFFYLGIQCQRFDNWSNSFLSEDYLKRYINGLVKRYFELFNLG